MYIFLIIQLRANPWKNVKYQPRVHHYINGIGHIILKQRDHCTRRWENIGTKSEIPVALGQCSQRVPFIEWFNPNLIITSLDIRGKVARSQPVEPLHGLLDDGSRLVEHSVMPDSSWDFFLSRERAPAASLAPSLKNGVEDQKHF